MTDMSDDVRSGLSPFADDDHFHDECGVFGIFNHHEAARLVAFGLHALQHRGQEAAGIVSRDQKRFYSERHVGLVSDNFTKNKVMDRLEGNRAIGHNRYSTAGGSGIHNIQPLFAEFAGGGFAVCHNGNLTNAFSLRSQLQKKGSIFQSTADTEVIIHLIANSEKTQLIDRFIDALHALEGAFALIALSEKKLIGCRDPYGVRPLVLGWLNDAPVLASETCALDIIGATYERSIEPGELVVITEDGIQSLRPFDQKPSRFCIFEHIYFARPDSYVDNVNVYEVRKRIGAELAREFSVDADIVIPVPDSGTPSAIGFAREAGLPFDIGITRNQYVGRTFIEPTDNIRHTGVKLKHNANRALLSGKRIILVDDSIVRGTTSTKIVQMVRDAGAKEVHMRIASPPTVGSCYYGVDTPEASKLIASKKTTREIADVIGADSLEFLTLGGLYRAVSGKDRNDDDPGYCDACFTKKYPISLTDVGDDGMREFEPRLSAAE